MTIAGGVAFVVTSVLFLAVPLVDMISYVTNERQELRSPDLARPPPPPPPEEKPPQDKERREETLELVKPRPRMVFDQPDVGLSPGTGGASLSGDLSFDFSADETEMVFEMGEVDKNPRATSEMPPNYPDSLKRARIEGEIMIEYVVGSDGRVKSVVVLSGDDSLFVKSAITAVKRWKYKPAIRNGKAVSVRIRRPIGFSVGKR